MKLKVIILLHYFTTQVYSYICGWWWFSHQVVSDSCDSMDYSLPGSFVYEIFQARILDSDAISFSNIYVYISCILFCIYTYIYIYFFSFIQSLTFSGLPEGSFTYARRVFAVIMWQLWFYIYPFPQPPLNGYRQVLWPPVTLLLCAIAFACSLVDFLDPLCVPYSTQLLDWLCGLLTSFQRHQRQIRLEGMPLSAFLFLQQMGI